MPIKNPLRCAVSLFLSAALIALAPGIQPYQLFAQAVYSPQVGRVPDAVGTPAAGPSRVQTGFSGLQLRLSPARLSGALPSLSAPKPSPSLQPVAAAPAVSIIPAAVIEEGGKKLEVPALAQELAPELEAAGKLEKASPQAAPGVGRRILDIILRRKSGAPAALVQVPEAPPAPSGLAKASPEAVKQPAAAVPVPRDPILKDLAEHPPAAVIFDYDGTLTIHGPGGLSLPVSQDVVDGIISLLKQGVPVGFNTGRSLKEQPAGISIPMTLWDPLLSKIPADLRSNIFFAGRLGAETGFFDAQGGITGHLENDWAAAERAGIEEAVAASLKAVKASRADAAFIDAPGFSNIVFKLGDKRAAKFSQAMMKQFAKRGIPFQVNFNSKNWVYFSKYTKGDGLRLIVSAMRGRGFAVTDSNLLLVGDEFRAAPGEPVGGDAGGALAFPKSRAVSVGDAPGDVLPANVRRLGQDGGVGSLAVINAVLEGLAPKTASDAEMEAFYKAERARSIRAALATAAVMSIPFLWTHAAVAAMAGSIMLTVIGLPQIIKNFREGPAATKDLAIDGYLIWYGAAVLLTAASLLRHANFWWVASNVAGVAESLAVIFQLNAHRKDPALFKKSLKVVLGSLALMAPLALGLFLPASVWASAAFAGAMALLFILNAPQIRMNYAAYAKDGKVPSGIAWSYPALVAGGSLLSLIPAIAAGDAFWVLNSLAAIVTTGVVLGQIFLPKQTNALLSRVMAWRSVFGGKKD